MDLKLLFFCAFIVVANGHTTTYGPSPLVPLNNDPLSTGEGSFFEYAVRNVIRNAFYYPRVETNSRTTDLEQMVYYYHLQMMHIDLSWLRTWQGLHRSREPDILDLPSRAVHYDYDHDVRYNFGGSEPWTLDSHRFRCEECVRQFKCNVNHLHRHLGGLESLQMSSTYQVADMSANRPLIPANQQLHCGPMASATSTTSTTTENTYRYDVYEHDELKK